MSRKAAIVGGGSSSVRAATRSSLRRSQFSWRSKIGLLPRKTYFGFSGSCFTTEADEDVEIKGGEPRLMSSRVLLCCPKYWAKPDRASASQSAVAPRDDHRFCQSAFAMVHHFAAAGRMAYIHHTLEVEMFGQPPPVRRRNDVRVS
jgi:hypothetical protein